MAWLGENIGWMLVLAGLIGVVTAIVVGMVKEKKSGKCSCCGDCKGCPHSCGKRTDNGQPKP